MSKVSSGCCCSHYHIIRKVSNTLAGSALPLPPLTRSGRSSDSFQPTDYHMVAQPGKEEAKKHLKFVESEDEDRSGLGQDLTHGRRGLPRLLS